MTEKRQWKLTSMQTKTHVAQQVYAADLGKVVTIQPATRSLEQNAHMWAQLSDISRQVEWYGNRLTAEEWKDVFSASLKKQRAVPGIDGGFVIIGQRTSKMTKGEMSDLIELMNAFCAERGVIRSASEWEFS